MGKKHKNIASIAIQLVLSERKTISIPGCLLALCTKNDTYSTAKKMAFIDFLINDDIRSGLLPRLTCSYYLRPSNLPPMRRYSVRRQPPNISNATEIIRLDTARSFSDFYSLVTVAPWSTVIS
ncbi:hypothetical protein V6Z93_002736 [Aspergillus fumigatus]